MPTLKLNKFDVAERQLFQAIHMFFREEDPVSIHTISEAAGQILYDIGEDYGAVSIKRGEDLIKEEHKSKWFGYIFKSRNFFKHADRDKAEIHEFNTDINKFSIFDAVALHLSIKTKWTPETLAYCCWFIIEHPHLIREGTNVEGLYNKAKSNDVLPNSKDKQSLSHFIKMVRAGQISKGNVTLEYGL